MIYPIGILLGRDRLLQITCFLSGAGSLRLVVPKPTIFFGCELFSLRPTSA